MQTLCVLYMYMHVHVYPEGWATLSDYSPRSLCGMTPCMSIVILLFFSVPLYIVVSVKWVCNEEKAVNMPQLSL